MKRDLIFVISILFTLTCCNSKNNSIHSYENSISSRNFEFKKIDSKIFPLDSTTTGGNNNFQYIEGEGKNLIAYLNKNQNTLIFYDYKNEKLDFKLRMEIEGPNGVGNISGFLVNSLDSIFVYSYRSAWLYHINRFGKIVNMYDFKNSGKGFISRPYISGNQPIMKRGDFLFLNNWGSQREYYRNKDYPESLLAKINLTKNEINYEFSYPEIYSTGVWGMQLHVMYNTINPLTSEIILGFPIDDYIYVLKDGEFEKYRQGSKYFEGVNPLSTKSRINAPPPKMEVHNERVQSTYRTIHFDPYNQIYMRVVYKPISEEILALNDPILSVFPKASLLILDNEFNKIGEVDFDNHNYWINNIFVNENGIHIMKMDFVNEDILTFDVFKFELDGKY